MAADVTSIVRIMEAHREEADGKRRGLLTRDLLGDGAVAVAVISSTELDLDLQVPSGWERRLDLKSGKTYLHRLHSDPPSRELHDLNLPPPSHSSTFSPDSSSLLDLTLAAGGFSAHYQSVCTLDKVKSALDRANRTKSEWQICTATSASASPSSSTTSSSLKRLGFLDEDDGGSDSAAGMMAAACPSCLLYVLISKASPRCPRCDSLVPVPFLPKKPRFDLNSCC